MPDNYTSLNDVTKLQEEIMKFVEIWVHEKKTPVPLKEIIAYMEKQETKNFTTIKALNSLIEKRYLRRAYTISNKTFFVQLRRLQ